MSENFVLPNPVVIDHIVYSNTKSKLPQIELWLSQSQYMVLSLFDSQFGQLLQMGIDPNDLEMGKKHYTHFYAYWEHGEKENSKGNKYKNVTRLERIPTEGETTLFEEMQTIKQLATLIGIQQYGSRQALAEAYKANYA